MWDSGPGGREDDLEKPVSPAPFDSTQPRCTGRGRSRQRPRTGRPCTCGSHTRQCHGLWDRGNSQGREKAEAEGGLYSGTLRMERAHESRRPRSGRLQGPPTRRRKVGNGALGGTWSKSSLGQRALGLKRAVLRLRKTGGIESFLPGNRVALRGPVPRWRSSVSPRSSDASSRRSRRGRRW